MLFPLHLRSGETEAQGLNDGHRVKKWSGSVDQNVSHASTHLEDSGGGIVNPTTGHAALCLTCPQGVKGIIEPPLNMAGEPGHVVAHAFNPSIWEAETGRFLQE